MCLKYPRKFQDFRSLKSPELRSDQSIPRCASGQIKANGAKLNQGEWERTARWESSEHPDGSAEKKRFSLLSAAPITAQPEATSRPFQRGGDTPAATADA